MVPKIKRTRERVEHPTQLKKSTIALALPYPRSPTRFHQSCSASSIIAADQSRAILSELRLLTDATTPENSKAMVS